MLKDKLVCFIIKRLLICCIIISIADIIFIKQIWHVLIGLFIGGTFSILRFGSYTAAFKGILSINNQDVNKKHYASSNMVVFVLNQIILLPLLFFAFKLSQNFFIGIVEGVLLVPLVVFINSFTEAFKITHNNFE